MSEWECERVREREREREIERGEQADQVKDSGGVSSESGHLGEGGVAPENDLVLGVAVSANYFVGAL